MENGLPGRIGLHVHRHARIANPIRETSREKPDQELAPTLHQPMVAMIAEAAKMMLIFATRTFLVVRECLLIYYNCNCFTKYNQFIQICYSLNALFFFHVSDSCFDGILNQNEEKVDCGGVCDACRK